MNESLPRLLLLSHFAATLFMIGVIWFVQVVHYPLFAKTGSADFRSYEQLHTSLTTWVVAPPMLVEGITALLLFWFRPTGVSTWQLSIGLTLLAVICTRLPLGNLALLALKARINCSKISCFSGE